MKKTIPFLLFLLQVCALQAQYDITWKLVTGISPPTYRCTITPNPPSTTTDFTKLDLITWIFPDGQFMQQEIEPDKNTGLITNSSTIDWQPYVDAPSGPNEVVAYVAKKGQPGNPPKRIAQNPITGTFSGNPASFAMAATDKWQINRSWEFAPGKEAFLIVSYRIDAICDISFPPSKIKLTYNPNFFSPVATENLAYQNESILGPTIINASLHEVEINNLRYNGKINHVYLKFKLENTVKEGTKLNFGVGGNVCGEVVSDRVLFLANGTPHDPNEKIVNKPVICSSQPGPTPLNYYIRFHNDGIAPVNEVDVEDNLPVQLIPSTWILDPIASPFLKQSKITGNQFLVKFQKLGLPGLNQTNPHYAYDQTTFDFTFNVSTQSNLTSGTFSNRADVYFLDVNGRLPVVYTNYSVVKIDSCTTSSKEQATVLGNLKITPNPSTEVFNLFVELTKKTHLVATIRSLDGRIVEEVTNKEYLAGAYQLYWNSTGVPVGVYLLDIGNEQGRTTRKIIKM